METALIEAKSMMIQNKAFQVTGFALTRDKKHTKMVETTYNKTPFKAYFDRHSNSNSFFTKNFT